MDDKLKHQLKTEMNNMDTVVNKLKYNNQLNTSWRRLKSVLMDHLKTTREEPSLFDKKIN